MKPVTQIVLLGVAALAVGGAWAVDLPARLSDHISGDAKAGRVARPKQSPLVVVRDVEFASDAAVVQAVGSGRALKAVVLSPEAEGLVTDVLFKAGDRVKTGQPLIKLESDEERLAVELATVNFNSAQRTLRRYESVDAGRAVAQNQLDAARRAFSLARIGLARAKLALRRRTLSAPFDGVVGIPSVQAGHRVTKTSRVATLDDRSALLVEFEVPAAYAFGVRKGMSFKAITWARRGETFTGIVADLGSQVDSDTRTLRVRAHIPNQKDTLRPGMAFSITLPLAGREYPSVPSVAIRWRRKGAFVWVVRNEIARRIAVDVIKRNEGWVLVSARLGPGDVVVVEGVQRLRPGLKVRVEKLNDDKAEKPQ